MTLQSAAFSRKIALLWSGLALLLTLFPAPETSAKNRPSRPTHLFVSLSGNDAWAGKKNRPFATLARAQRVVRTLTERMKSDIVVNLRGGTHTLTEPLDLSAAAGDSGENGHRVVYQAYGYGTPAQERVLISGGREVSGWQLVDQTKGIWRAEAGSLNTRQLYVNGRRAERAALGAGIPGTLVQQTETGYQTDSTEPQSWSNPHDIEAVYFGASGWSEPRCGVAGVSSGSLMTTITMDQPCFAWANEYYGAMGGLIFPTDLENSMSFLDRPGEWYLDRSDPGKHVLYYIPRAGETLSKSTVIAPVLERLVSGSGGLDDPLHDISFKGLTFSYATWLGPSRNTGFPQAWAGYLYNGGGLGPSGQYQTVPGNLVFHRADRIVFEGNRFTRLGADGLEFTDNSSKNVVSGNVFNDISGGGIHIGPGESSVGNVAANNWVHDTGREYPGLIGIWLAGTQDSIVAHNQVNDVSYTGIALSYAGADGATHGQRAVNNHVFNTLRSGLLDGGGIYLTGAQGTSFADGAVVAGNLVHDVPFIGIYTDYFADWETVDANVLYRNTHSIGGVCPKHVQFVNNFWDNDSPQYQNLPWTTCPLENGPGANIGQPEGVTYRDNTLLPTDNPRNACMSMPSCERIIANAGLQPAYRHLLNGPR